MTAQGAFTRICSPRFLDMETKATRLLSEPGDRFVTAGPGAGDQAESLAPIHRELAETVAKVAQEGGRPFAVVGDCCQVIPVMAGLARSDVQPTLIWLDSHGDFNTWETTPSGFLGGMPLAMLTGRGDQRLMQAVGLQPIPDTRVVLSDGRDLDPGERMLVETSGIALVPDLAALDPAALPDGPLYVHFDADIIAAEEAPAFLYPVRGGPSAEQMRTVLASLFGTGRVMCFSVCASWDTLRDGDGRTVAAVKQALTPLQGQESLIHEIHGDR
jgi:arginase